MAKKLSDVAAEIGQPTQPVEDPTTAQENADATVPVDSTGGGGGGIEQDAQAPTVAAAQAPTDNDEQPISPAVEVAPNVLPCFDFDPATKQAILLPGEEVLVLTDKYGFPTTITSYGRKVFSCSLDEYEAKVGPLVYARALYEAAYPQAVAR